MRLHGRGVLVRGPSGAGKSSLCAALIEQGGWLVADDAVDLRVESGVLVARSPRQIAGHLERRGLGIAVLPAVQASCVDLVVELSPSVTIERLPSPAATGILGIVLPLIYIAPHGYTRGGSYVSAAMARLVREVP